MGSECPREPARQIAHSLAIPISFPKLPGNFSFKINAAFMQL